MIGNLKLNLQLATQADALEIARMSRDLIEQGLGWSWTPRRVLHSVVDQQTNVVVALKVSNLLGFGIMKYHEEEAHLLLLAVHPAVVRRGVGRRLLAWLEKAAITAGVGQVYLEVRASNAAARAFYRRAGYAEIQHLPGYYQGQEPAVRLAKDLWLDQA